MKQNEGKFTGHDGLGLYYQSWHPDNPPRAVIIIVPGMGDHCGRYLNIVAPLVEEGYAFYAADHRGHGRSPGPRAYVNAWSEYVDDLGNFVDLVRQREPERPLFLYGHSMGGNITLNYVLRYPAGLAGVIASAPAVGKLDVPPILALLSRLLSGIWPSLSLNTGLDVAAISRDPAAIAAYQSDPLVHGKGTPRFAVEFTRAAEWAMANAARFEPPLLMLHGDADSIVNISASRDFFARVPGPDKQLIIYEDGRHESHNDLQCHQVAADVSAWLATHLVTPAVR